MLIERQKRMSRVRFKHPIRVVTLEGQPRVIRTLTANVSRKGLFLRMPEPLPLGTKVALSLEAGGRALALAQAEVVWGRVHESQLPGRFPGCGVRFTEFMHPRAQELVDYLVHNLDRGKPLLLAPPERAWMRWLPAAGGVALLACAALATLLLWPSSSPSAAEEEPDAPTLEMVAAPPLVHPVRSTANEGADAVAVVKEAALEPPAAMRGEAVEPGPALVPTSPAPSAPEAPLAKATEVDPLVAKKARTEVVVQAASPEAALSKPDAESPVAKNAGAEGQAAPSGPEAPLAKRTEAESPSAADSRAAQKEVAPVQPAATEPKVPVVGKTDAQAPSSAAAPKAAVAKKPDAEAPSSAAELPGARPSTEKKGAAPSREAARQVVAPKAAALSSSKTEGGKIKLPSGAAPSLSWTLKGSELRLSPELLGQAQVARAFVLAGPPRAVFDITGSTPSRSHTVPASPPFSTAVRLGKLPSGTRLVIDLDAPPKRSSQDGSSLVLSF